MSRSLYDAGKPRLEKSPYRSLDRLRTQMRAEITALREEVLANKVTIEDLKERLNEEVKLKDDYRR